LSGTQGPARADSLRPVLGAVALLFVALLGAAGLRSYRDLTTARAHEKQLETRIEESRAGIDRLRGRIARLRSDPVTLESLAREDLGLVKQGDVVIELPGAPADSPSSAAPLSAAPPLKAAPPPAAPTAAMPPLPAVPAPSAAPLSTEAPRSPAVPTGPGAPAPPAGPPAAAVPP
jgi:cell division protein FtsB